MEGTSQVVNTLDISEDSASWARRITRLPQPDRIVAIGDLHGDIDKARECLRLAGVMADSENWTGGKTMVVQVGDILDRGKDEFKILSLFEKLQKQALGAGGQIITLLGNHEIMNMKWGEHSTKIVSPEYQVWKTAQILKGEDKEEDYAHDMMSSYYTYLHQYVRVRVQSLQKGGPITKRFFGNSPSVLVVGSTVFVHGGLRKEHIEYGLERINKETRDWVLRKGDEKFLEYHTEGRNGITWMRDYSRGSRWNKNPEMFYEALGSIPNAERMVVGHSIQRGGKIRFYYGLRLAAIDIGMSCKCKNARPEVLEIRGNGDVGVLSMNEVVDPATRALPMPQWEQFETLFKQISESNVSDKDDQNERS